MKWLMLLSLSMSAFGQVQTWNNPQCLAGGICEVRSVKVKVTTEGAMAKMIAEVKTTTPDQLRKYAFVQYIRGCVFQTNAQGENQYRVRSYQGQDGVRFKHENWQIDSVTKDPIYFSTRNPGWDELRGFEIPRNANYLVIDPTNGDEARWGGKLSNIVDNRLFVFDTPTGGNALTSNRGVSATNSSLEFKICLHEIEGIPRRVEDPNFQVPNPIVCLDWDARFHYNFTTRRFNRSTTLHPYCRPE